VINYTCYVTVNKGTPELLKTSTRNTFVFVLLLRSIIMPSGTKEANEKFREGVEKTRAAAERVSFYLCPASVACDAISEEEEKKERKKRYTGDR